MIWISEDLCVARVSICSVEWLGEDDMQIGLISGQFVKPEPHYAKALWSILTGKAEDE